MRKVLIHLGLLCVMLIGVFAFSSLYYNRIDLNQSLHGEMSLNENWYVRINDVTVEPYMDLSCDRFSMLDKGDVLEISRRLPVSLPRHPMLIFRTVHSDIEVKLDGEVIYEYGKGRFDEGKMVGYGYHFIALENEDAAKKITITMRVSENNAFSSLEAPHIANADYVQRDYLVNNRLSFVIILFLVTFGIALLLITFISWRGVIDSQRLLCISMFSLTIGIWSLCTTDLMRFFTYNYEVRNFLEFFSLYLAPIFVFGYFWQELRSEGGIRWIIYLAEEIALMVFAAVALIAHLTDIAHLPALLNISHVLMALAIILVMLKFFTDVIMRQFKNPVLANGFEVLAIFVLVDLVRFNMLKYSDRVSGGQYTSIIYIGVLIFEICLLVDFAKRSFKTFYAQAEKEALEKLAYTDELTGLFNRRRFDEVIEEIAISNQSYAMIGFDLNYLKQVNDTKGHKEGDEYIKEFSNCLATAFEGVGKVFRVGGDEFYAVIVGNKARIRLAERFVVRLNRKIAAVNAGHSDWKMSAAYGICRSDEAGVHDVNEAIKLADERMYDCKARMKAGR